MNKITLGAAALMLAATALPARAQAPCAWTGYAWSCPGPYGYAPYAGGYPYSGAENWWTGGLGYYGPAQQYSSSRNGPDPGGGFRHMGRSNVGHTD